MSRKNGLIPITYLSYGLFTISADVTQTYKNEIKKVKDWTRECRVKRGKRELTGREWAEIVFVPASHALLTDIPKPFRYIVVRERLGDQLSLLDLESDVQETDKMTGLPFQTMTLGSMAYKIAAIVTNRREESGEELIQCHTARRGHYERCGKSEEVHSIMKGDPYGPVLGFAGGQLPSSKFGANAAWWSPMIPCGPYGLSVNFQSIMKQLVIGSSHATKRMKAIRYDLINTAGRIVLHSRQRLWRLSGSFHHWLASLREGVTRQRLATT